MERLDPFRKENIEETPEAEEEYEEVDTGIWRKCAVPDCGKEFKVKFKVRKGEEPPTVESNEPVYCEIHCKEGNPKEAKGKYRPEGFPL